MVQFDLLIVEGQPVIHIIDEATRFTWLELVEDREDQTILDAISDTWIDFVHLDGVRFEINLILWPSSSPPPAAAPVAPAGSDDEEDRPLSAR